jgi:hypothetical protein
VNMQEYLRGKGTSNLSLSGILVSLMLVQKCCSVGMVAHEQGPKSVAEGVDLFPRKVLYELYESMTSSS